MKNIFVNKVKKAISGTLLLMLLFSIFNIQVFTSAAAVGPTFYPNPVQANVAEVTEIKATRTLTVNSLPADGESIIIGTSTITFINSTGATVDQTNTSGGTGFIDTTVGAEDTLRTASEIAAILRTLTNVFDVGGHGELSVSGSGDNVIFTTIGGETEAEPISFIDVTSGDVTSTSSTTSVVAVAAKAQVVDFIPGSYILDHLLYKVDINGVIYGTHTNSGTTVKSIVDALSSSLGADTAVNCTDDDIKITCTAKVAGTAFTYTGTSIVDKTSLYNAINAEFSDSGARTTYILDSVDYSTDSWNAYTDAIEGAKSVETSTSATDTNVSDAITLISTKKSELQLYSVPGEIDNATNSFVSSVGGAIGLSNLEVGGVYSLMSGSTLVSSGVLVATNPTHSIELNPSYFLSYGSHTLTLSGTYNGTTTSNITQKTLYVGPFDYQDLYVNQVYPALTASGVINNLDDVTYTNVMSFTGLYFEETGLGKVSFSGALNLTDSGTILFLQHLPEYLEMENGMIDFDPSSSAELNAYGANISMYFSSGSSFVGAITNPEDFVVRSSIGVILDSSDILSNIHGACGVGETYCTLFFDTGHFTEFDLRPVLTDVIISSNNSYSSSLAKPGDRAILSFTGSETLTGITVKFGGVDAQNIVGTGTTWTATSVPFGTGASGVVSFSIDYSDTSANTGTTVTSTTNSSSITVDKDSPFASVEYNPSSWTKNDVIATLTGASENIVVTNNSGNTNYTFTENGSFTFQLRDDAGNTGSVIASVNYINKANPTVTLIGSGSITVEKGTPYTELWANWSDFKDGTGTLSSPSDLSGSVDINTLGTYFIEYIKVNSLGNTGSTTRTINVVDTTPPSVPTITSTGTLTAGTSIGITGTGSANEFVKIFSGATEVANGSINGAGLFSVSVALVEGNNTFVAKSYDSSGNYSGNSNTYTIVRDTTDPLISRAEVKDIKETSVSLMFTYTEPHFTAQSGSVVVDDGAGFSGAYLISYSGNNGSSSLIGLVSDTSYNYILTLRDDVGNTMTSAGTFSTAKVLTLSGTLSETGAVSLGFTGDLNEGETYTLSGNLLIDSDENDLGFLTGNLTLSGVNIVVSSGTWDGILIPPTLIDNSLDESATGSEIGTGVTVIQTVKVGSEDSGLSASGGYFEVSFIIPGYSSGTTFSLYRSENGNSWVLNTPDNHCTLDANSLCSFRTDHLSFFAPGLDTEPDTFSFTAQTEREISTVYESNTITISGTDTGSTVSVVGGEYKIGTGTYTLTNGVVNSGNTITVRMTSSSSYSTLKTATLTVGGVNANFNVTTKASSSSSSSSSGGGGGSGPTLVKDTCPDGDTSGNDYDGYCGIKIKESNQTETSLEDEPDDNLNGSIKVKTNVGMGTGMIHLEFSDTENSFAKDDIKTLLNMGIVKGYGDGTFRPENPITRSEFLSIVMKAFEIDLSSSGSNVFDDVPEDAWVKIYLVKAFELGMINGQIVDGKRIFRPNDSISRAEALAILFKVAKIERSDGGDLEFLDDDFSPWMIPYVINAKRLHIIDGQIIDSVLKFRPNSSITRAEAVKIIVGAMNKK